MLDDGFEDRLKEAVRDYNAPPQVPREAMWAAIRAERAGRTDGQPDGRTGAERPSLPPYRRTALRPYLLWSSGIAATLALGFGLGRVTTEQGSGSVQPGVAHTATNRGSEPAYRVATTEHLGQSEAFLTLFRTSVRGGGGNQSLASATARQLLATNRLLLDSPAAQDARTRLLLQDLELVLAEIAQLAPEPSSRDLDLIDAGLEQGGTLWRLRTAVPAGASTTQGAL